MIAVGQGKEEKQHRVPHLIGLSHREYLGILYSMYATSDRFLARDTATQMYPMTPSIFIGCEHSYCASYCEVLYTNWSVSQTTRFTILGKGSSGLGQKRTYNTNS